MGVIYRDNTVAIYTFVVSTSSYLCLWFLLNYRQLWHSRYRLYEIKMDLKLILTYLLQTTFIYIELFIFEVTHCRF